MVAAVCRHVQGRGRATAGLVPPCRMPQTAGARMSDEKREFKYGPPIGLSWMAIVISLVLGAGMLTFVFRPPPGGLHGRGLNFTQEQTPAASGVFSVFFFTLVIWQVALLVRHQRIKQTVVFTDHAMSIPKSSWSDEKVIIPYREVRKVQLFKNRGWRYLIITHAGGESKIMSGWLDHPKGCLIEICGFLRSRVKCEVPEIK